MEPWSVCGVWACLWGSAKLEDDVFGRQLEFEGFFVAKPKANPRPSQPLLPTTPHLHPPLRRPPRLRPRLRRLPNNLHQLVGSSLHDTAHRTPHTSTDTYTRQLPTTINNSKLQPHNDHSLTS